MVSNMKNPIEIYVEIKHETEEGEDKLGAVLVSDGINKFWLPKSEIKIEHRKDGHAEITLPEWLAIKKEII